MVKEEKPEGIVPVLDVIEVESDGFSLATIVMEKFDGTMFDGKLVTDWEWVCEEVKQVNRGLDWLHARGMVHHDVKPKNLLYRTDKDMSKAALCDFESVCRTAPPGSPSWVRWQKGWEPLRWTAELLHPQHESVEPRQIDLYALAQVLRENAAPSPLLLSLGLSNSSEQQDTRKRAAEVPIGSGVAEEEDVEGREHQAVDAEERSSGGTPSQKRFAGGGSLPPRGQLTGSLARDCRQSLALSTQWLAAPGSPSTQLQPATPLLRPPLSRTLGLRSPSLSSFPNCDPDLALLALCMLLAACLRISRS